MPGAASQGEIRYSANHADTDAQHLGSGATRRGVAAGFCRVATQLILAGSAPPLSIRVRHSIYLVVCVGVLRTDARGEASGLAAPFRR
jgi:hypothetical protein